jgi:hypothetical protein
MEYKTQTQIRKEERHEDKKFYREQIELMRQLIFWVKVVVVLLIAEMFINL